MGTGDIDVPYTHCVQGEIYMKYLLESEWRLGSLEYSS